MAQISTIGAGLYTELAYVTAAADLTDDTETELEGLTFVDVGNVREFPSVGVPANIVNVPVFGSATSSQITAQADAPNLEFTLNYIPGNTQHEALRALVSAGSTHTFRIRLANAELPATLIATTEHSDFYVHARVASFLVNPSLSDANTATMTLAAQSEFYGPFTTS